MIDPTSVVWRTSDHVVSGISMYQFLTTIKLHHGVTKEHVYDLVQRMNGWCETTFGSDTKITIEEIMAGSHWGIQVFFGELSTVEIVDGELKTKSSFDQNYDIMITMGLVYATQFKMGWTVVGEW